MVFPYHTHLLFLHGAIIPGTDLVCVGVGIGVLHEFSLNTHYFSQCIATAPVWIFKNLWKSEHIETQFRSIISNDYLVKLQQFPQVSYSHVVRRRIGARIKWTPWNLFLSMPECKWSGKNACIHRLCWAFTTVSCKYWHFMVYNYYCLKCQMFICICLRKVILIFFLFIII